MNKTIKRLVKFGIFVGVVAGTMYAVNRCIEKAANVLNKLKFKEDSYYKWRLGNVYYEKTGEGSPVLLIHDYTPYASSFEWEHLVSKLAEEHTVYTVDLLGCGRSDKPAITYTNFVYVQLISDFINDVIKEKTDIITSGYASSFAVMSTNYTCENIKNLLLINPASLDLASKEPDFISKIKKALLELPLIGTFLYNMIMLRYNIESVLTKEYFYDNSISDDSIIDIYYEAAHKGNGSGKYVLSSIMGNYMEAMVQYALTKCNNNIYIIGGEYQDDINAIIEEYQYHKSDIKYEIISNTKRLPHYEDAETVLKQIKTYLF